MDEVTGYFAKKRKRKFFGGAVFFTSFFASWWLLDGAKVRVWEAYLNVCEGRIRCPSIENDLKVLSLCTLATSLSIGVIALWVYRGKFHGDD